MNGTDPAEAAKTRRRYTPGEVLRILEMETAGRSRGDIARLHERPKAGISGLIDDLLANRRPCPDLAKPQLTKLREQNEAALAAKAEKAGTDSGQSSNRAAARGAAEQRDIERYKTILLRLDAMAKTQANTLLMVRTVIAFAMARGEISEGELTRLLTPTQLVAEIGETRKIAEQIRDGLELFGRAAQVDLTGSATESQDDETPGETAGETEVAA